MSTDMMAAIQRTMIAAAQKSVDPPLWLRKRYWWQKEKYALSLSSRLREVQLDMRPK
jgi:hypothetical protein